MTARGIEAPGFVWWAWLGRRGVLGGKGGFFGVLEGIHKHLMLTFFWEAGRVLFVPHTFARSTRLESVGHE